MKVMLGRHDDAATDLQAVPELLKRSKKINGRPLPFDRFVKRKIQNYFDPKTSAVYLLLHPPLSALIPSASVLTRCFTGVKDHEEMWCGVVWCVSFYFGG
jgi:hypothetical protein